MYHRFLVFCFLIFLSYPLCAQLLYETSYRPRLWYLVEPRIEKDWLSTWDIIIDGGNSDKARLCSGNSTCLSEWLCPNLSRSASFRMIDLYVTWIQNLKQGFFLLVSGLPMRSLKITSLKQTITAINHPGDTRGYIGWTKTYLDTSSLDFIDFTVAFGVLFPTSNQVCSTNPLGLSTGFNHHWGGLASASVAWGMYEWLNWGIWMDGIFLAKRNFSYSPGTVWSLGTYLKADHFIKGLSLLVGYSFEQKRADRLTIKNCCLPIGQQETSRHVLHTYFEWDGQTCEHPHRPRIQFFYNYTITGKNIITTFNVGGLLGFDVAWCF